MTPKGTLFFDASCGVCSEGARRWSRWAERRGFAAVPLQEDGVAELLGLAPGELPKEVILRQTDGALLGGIDALGAVARTTWWTWPLFGVTRVPGLRQVLKIAYAAFAARRQKISAVCGLRPMIAK